ncbi:hypothetical protein LshimejAT787_3800030 [Lyophyllum shimeji]|uniref:Uncharacterized protein n=1 Tax=Lyophyllum shimeji TaxID=47721 RepID=A0A9P3Q2K4_LYOSH|nr:hypothetical protein LshimejAT787_3800030 [Lyophyllum shimeji]
MHGMHQREDGHGPVDLVNRQACCEDALPPALPQLYCTQLSRADQACNCSPLHNHLSCDNDSWTLADAPEAAPRRRNAPASDCEPDHKAHAESGNTSAVDVAGPRDGSNSSNPSSSTSVQSPSSEGHGFFHHAHDFTVQGGTYIDIGRDFVVNYGSAPADTVTKSDSKKATYKRCPPPTRYFKGRQKILAEMAAYFFNGIENQHVCVLHGLGGVGKTQIAYQFVERCAKERRFSEVFLVDASTVDTITTDLSNISLGKNIGTSADEAHLRH